MADIKVLYINSSGMENEHSESSDSVKFLSFKTANKELTDSKLSHLIDGAEALDEHIHDNRYYRENEHITTSSGIADANKPLLTGAAGKLDTSFINVSTLNPLLDHGTMLGLADDDHTQYLKTDGTRNVTGVMAYAVHPTFNDDKQLVDKKYVDDLAAGDEWYDSAVDRIFTPPASPTSGSRYLINGGTATGAWVGKDNQVATWSGTAWIYQIPTTGVHISIDDEPEITYLFGGSTWVAKYYESSTASTGLTKVGFDVQIDPASAGPGLGFAAGIYNVNVDNSSIEINADTLRIKALGIKDSMIDFGTGANQVSGVDLPLQDSANYFPTKNAEAALQFLAAQLLANGTDYTVGTGGVTKGDLVYVSANNTVLPFTTLTNNSRCLGIALATATAGQTVRVLANDVVLTGILTGATAGTPYYWTGTGFSITPPSASNTNVWLGGVARNATDLHIEVLHIKKNSV